MPDSAALKAVAFADAAFLRVLRLPHDNSDGLRVAFADASEQLLHRLQRQGECAEVIAGVRVRCQGLVRSIPLRNKGDTGANGANGTDS